MLANDLAKAVADFGAAVVSVCRLRRELVRLAVRMCRLGKGTNLLDRADAYAIGLAQSSVDCSGLRDTHFGAVDQGRDIRRIGVAVAHETSAIAGSIKGNVKKNTSPSTGSGEELLDFQPCQR